MALGLATSAGFASAAAAIHHLRGDYAAALAAQLAPRGQQQQQQGLQVAAAAASSSSSSGSQGGEGPFSYVRGFLERGGASAVQRQVRGRRCGHRYESCHMCHPYIRPMKGKHSLLGSVSLLSTRRTTSSGCVPSWIDEPHAAWATTTAYNTIPSPLN